MPHDVSKARWVTNAQLIAILLFTIIATYNVINYAKPKDPVPKSDWNRIVEHVNQSPERVIEFNKLISELRAERQIMCSDIERIESNLRRMEKNVQENTEMLIVIKSNLKRLKLISVDDELSSIKMIERTEKGPNGS